MKTVSCIPGISQQKTFNYSWLSCPFILWLNIFLLSKNPQKVTMSIKKKPFNFFNYFMKTHFLKSFLKEKSLNVFLIFHFWSMIFFFFFFTNAWPHTSEDITMQFYQLLGNYPFHSWVFFLLFSKANSCFHLFIHNYETCRS